MSIERLLTGNIGAQVKDLLATEDLVIEAFKDLIKDELKAYIREKVDADEELKEEIREAVSYYFHAKARSIYAELKASRAAARLGLRMLPDDLQGEVGEAIVGLFEKELGNLLEKAL
jgi:ribonucleotide reductase alpha subunit